MTRKEMKEWLEGIGIENPSNDQINSGMALFNTAKEDGTKDINVDEIKANYKKELETEFEEKLKGYVTNEVHNQALTELEGLKSAKAKDERIKKYVELGALNDSDVLDLLDTKFSKSENLDEEVKAYLGEHKTFASVKEEPKPELNPFQHIAIGGVGGSTLANNNGPVSLKEAIAQEYKK